MHSKVFIIVRLIDEVENYYNFIDSMDIINSIERVDYAYEESSENMKKLWRWTP